MRNTKQLPMFYYLAIGLLNAMLVSLLLVGLNTALRLVLYGTSQSWDALALGFAVDIISLTAISLTIIALPQCIGMAYCYGRRRCFGVAKKWYWAALEMWCVTGLVFALWPFEIDKISTIDTIKLAIISGFGYGVLPLLLIHYLEKWHEQSARLPSLFWGLSKTEKDSDAYFAQALNNTTNHPNNPNFTLTPLGRGLLASSMVAILSLLFFTITAWRDGLAMVLLFTTWTVWLVFIPQTIGMLYITSRQATGRGWRWMLVESTALFIVLLSLDILLQQFTRYTDYWISIVFLLGLMMGILSCAMVWAVEKIVVRWIWMGLKRKNKAIFNRRIH